MDAKAKTIWVVRGNDSCNLQLKLHTKQAITLGRVLKVDGYWIGVNFDLEGDDVKSQPFSNRDDAERWLFAELGLEWEEAFKVGDRVERPNYMPGYSIYGTVVRKPSIGYIPPEYVAVKFDCFYVVDCILPRFLKHCGVKNGNARTDAAPAAGEEHGAPGVRL